MGEEARKECREFEGGTLKCRVGAVRRRDTCKSLPDYNRTPEMNAPPGTKAAADIGRPPSWTGQAG